MNLPIQTLRAQLEAAYVALEVLGRDRMKYRAQAADLTVALQSARDEVSELSGERLRLNAQIAELQAEMATLAGRSIVLADNETETLRLSRLNEQALAEIARLSELVSEASWSRRLTAPWRLARRAMQRVLRSVKWYGVLIGNLPLDGLTHAAALWRSHISRPRTMWGVTPILTLPLLARCDRLLGLRADSLVFAVYYTTKAFGINLSEICNWIYENHPSWAVRFHKIVFRIALIRYDAFHLFCDRGLMLPTRRMEINEQEMQAMSRFGRRLYTYTYGADVRTREVTLSLGRYNVCAECPEPKKFCMCDDAEGRENISRIRGYATAMMAMGDMIHYVPGARNFHFWPIDTKSFRFVGSSWAKGRLLRIAHAPNHTHFKGTHYLEAAIEKLKSEGRQIELVRVQGVSNNQVISLFETCDLVADQFIAGFHGYTALESMALGKPVLCYLRDPSMCIDAYACPIINVSPDTVHAVLKDILDGRYNLKELGVRSRSYIEHYYSLEAVALRLGQLYLDTARFTPRVRSSIAERMATLKAELPPLAAGSPPTPREATTEDKDQQSLVA